MPRTISPMPTDVKTTIESADDLLEEIRRRAYELYEQRGRGDGGYITDWLRAE